MHEPGPRSTRWLITTPVAIALTIAACGGEEEGAGSRAAEIAAEASEVAAASSDDTAGDTLLLAQMPDLCPLLPAAEASDILGASASTPTGAPNEGRAGSLCRYVADRENRLGFELFMLPHAVWNPDAATIDELIAVSGQTGSSGPTRRVWRDAPGLGGYYADEDAATTVWIVTPYGFTAGMSDEADSQVYLRAYVSSVGTTQDRLDALADLAERVLPRLLGG